MSARFAGHWSNRVPLGAHRRYLWLTHLQLICGMLYNGDYEASRAQIAALKLSGTPYLVGWRDS